MTLPLAFALVLGSGLAFGARAQESEQLLKDRDLAKPAAALAEYFEALDAGKGQSEPKADFQSAFAAADKRVKDRSLLSSPADLGRMLWLSYDYGKKRPRKGRIEDVEVRGLFECALWVPSGYRPENAYPLVVSIPDQGRKPKTHLTEDWIDPELREAAVLVAPPMPEDYAKWTASDRDGGVARVLLSLRTAYESCAVDFDRVFLSGTGSGVAAALEIASKYPDIFAGVIGRAGDAGDTTPANFRNLPTYFTGGGSKASAFHAAAEEAGYGNSTLAPAGSEKDVLAWIGEQRRPAYPTRVTLVPGNPFPLRSHWIATEAYDAGGTPHIDAQVDRNTNTIRIDAKGVQTVTVLFNDGLVDLSRPVRVVCNDVENVVEIARSFETMLQTIVDARSDPSRVWVATDVFTVPVRAEGSGG